MRSPSAGQTVVLPPNQDGAGHKGSLGSLSPKGSSEDTLAGEGCLCPPLASSLRIPHSLENLLSKKQECTVFFPMSWQLYFCSRLVCLRGGAGLWASSSIRERQAKTVMQCVDGPPEPPSSHSSGWAVPSEVGGKGAVFQSMLASWLGWNPSGLGGVSYFHIC